jgi:hypothetical protein
MRSFLLFLSLCSASALADDVFHGWSKDGTWLVFQTAGENDIVELHFCMTDKEVKPTWPKELNDGDKEEGKLTCINLIDPNKAPYQWKTKVSAGAPSLKGNGMRVLTELIHDGENPGFVVEAGDKKQTCYASGVREDSRLQKVWWHPNGRWVAALIDGQFRHCALTVQPKAAPKGKK